MTPTRVLARLLSRSLLVVAPFAVAALAPGPRLAAAADAEPCAIAVKGDNPVVKACADGGIPKAKRAMKELVRTAKARGTKMECTDCHVAIDEWKLKDGATDRFRKLLEVAK